MNRTSRSIRRRHWPAVLAAMPLASAALAQQPAAKGSNAAQLRAQVDAVYQTVRASIVARNYDGFVTNMDSVKEAFSRQDFLANNDFLLNRYPDLATMRFQRIAVSGLQAPELGTS